MRPLDLSSIPKVDVGISHITNLGIQRTAAALIETVAERINAWTQTHPNIRFRGAIPGEFIPANGSSYVVSKFGIRGFSRLCLDEALTESLVRLTTQHNDAISDFDRGFIAALIGDLFDTLAAEGAPKVEIKIEQTPFSPILRLVSFQWEVRFEQSVGTLTWVADEMWWRQYLADWEQHPTPAPEGLQMVASIAIGHVVLPPDAFQGLDVGDVLLPSHGVRNEDFSTDQTGYLIINNNRAPLTLSVDGDRWHCKISQMTESSTSQWADTDVEIDVIVGNATVPLRELSAIQPGYVLDLALPVSNHVDLQVNGRSFAKAELVNLEGRLGVRVLSLTQP